MLNISRQQSNNNSCHDYYLNDGKNELNIIFGGNGDLYFCSNFFDRSQETEFYITKENMFIYNLFDELFNDFKFTNVFKVDEFELQFCETQEEIKEKYDHVRNRNEELKSDNFYKKLFDGQTITWISDDSVSFEVESSNSLQITPKNNQYKLKFTYYEDEFPYTRSIRIRNSGSRYYPFNIIMMRFFNKLQEYNPNYHQVEIEEYLYNKNKVKQLNYK